MIDDLDEEIRGHLALEIQERIERGESPEAARYAALRAFGNVALTRESIESVWRPRWLERAAAFRRDLRFALRSLTRARGLAATVVTTLALGIGANTAAFSVVHEVLMRPLVNRDQDRLLYIRQSAPGIGDENITFSVPEIRDLEARATTIAAFGEFSTINFNLLGAGEPRRVSSGVVSGSYFDVIGLRPVLGRLLNAGDDGPGAARVAVLTHRFWRSAFDADPAVVGRTVTIDAHDTQIVGVLEPSVPYPADTEIIANVATSAHHVDATMMTQRRHRMTELFGRLAPGATIDDARQELTRIHAEMIGAHPDAYPRAAATELRLSALRQQIAAPARTILFLLFAASAVVFLVACSNVANLILARGIRRESELAVCASLGASRWALRRMLLAESMLLCGAGAIVGTALAYPLVAVLSGLVARFSARALDVHVDARLLLVGGALAMLASVLLAFVPKLPNVKAATGFGVAGGGARITPGTNRRLRLFATSQIAFSFVLLAAAGTVLATLIALHTADTGYEMEQVLAIDVPFVIEDAGPRVIGFLDEASKRISRLPGVTAVTAGSVVPWRDAGSMPSMQVGADDQEPGDGRDLPHARLRMVSPGFFRVLGIPMITGRDFAEADDAASDRVAIISVSAAVRLFPEGDAIGRRLWWTEPVLGRRLHHRVVGIVADVDDESVAPQPAINVYYPVRQLGAAGRLFVQAAGNPYDLVPAVTNTIREIAPGQPVEHAATLADIRAEVLAPRRLNAFVLLGFAGVALLIAAVGVAGTLAFSVSARTREFGVRLAIGSSPRRLLVGVLAEGLGIVSAGVVAGAAGGYAVAWIASAFIDGVRMPGALPVLGATIVLAAAALAASLMPAAKASRVDVLQALRSE